MMKEKSLEESKSLIILKEISESLMILYKNPSLFDENEKLIQENIKLFSSQFNLQIKELREENPDVLLQVIRENKKKFSNIFRNFLALDLESSNNIIDLLKFLKEAKNEDKTKVQEKLYYIKEIIEFHTIPEYTYLGSAILWNRIDIAVKLVELGANVNIVTKRESCTYLHQLFRTFAFLDPIPKSQDSNFTIRNLSSLTHILVKTGVNVNSQNLHGNTALHYCVHRNNMFLAHHLLTCGAKTYIKNRDGDTPLHLALTKGNLEVAKLLLRYRDYPILENNEGKLPIDIAREKNYTEIIKIIENLSLYFKKKIQDVEMVPTKSDSNFQTSKENFTSR